MSSPRGGRFLSLRPRLTRAAAWLMGIQVGTYLVWLFLDAGNRVRVLRWIALTPADLARGHVWKLLTSALIDVNPFSLFFNLLALWMFLPVLEHSWGWRRFLGFAALATVVGNLAGAGLGLALGGGDKVSLLVGLSPFVYGAIAAYGVVFSEQSLSFFGVVPIKCKAFAIGIAIFAVLFTLLQRAWVEGAAILAAMGLGWAFAGGLITPNLWWLRWHRARLRRRLPVLDGGKKGPPKRWMN